MREAALILFGVLVAVMSAIWIVTARRRLDELLEDEEDR